MFDSQHRFADMFGQGVRLGPNGALSEAQRVQEVSIGIDT